MEEQSLIRLYVEASAEKRVDIIIKNYASFMGIVESYTEGLRYMIECDRESSSRQKLGELGVKTRSGGNTSDPTAKSAIRNVVIRDAIINCNFSSDILDGVDRAEAYIREAYALKEMRNDYDLFNTQLCVLGNDEDIFKQYISKKITLSDVAEKKGISYDYANQRMKKFRLLIKRQMIGFMERDLGGME